MKKQSFLEHVKEVQFFLGRQLSAKEIEKEKESYRKKWNKPKNRGK